MKPLPLKEFSKPKTNVQLSIPALLKIKTYSQSASKPTLYNIKKSTECNVFTIVLNSGDKCTFFINTVRKFFLSHIKLFSGTSNFETYAQSLKFVFNSIPLRSTDFSVIFGLNLVKCLYIFHLSLFLSLKYSFIIFTARSISF